MMHRSIARAAARSQTSFSKRATQQTVIKALLSSKPQQMPQMSVMRQQMARQSFLMGGQAPMRMFSSYPSHLKLDMPNLSPTMEKGNIGSWVVKVGDKVGPGDIICGIETDKATVDYEVQDEGYIAKILFPENTKDIPLGTPLAILVEDEDDIPAFADFVADASSAPASTPAAEPTPEPVASTPAASTPAAASKGAPAKSSGGRVFASPLAQNLANEQGVSLAGVQGTGPNGRIIKADVLEAAASGPVKAATPVFDSVPAAGFIDLENSNIRKVIADRLTYSKQNIPHYYVTVQVQVDNLMKMRAKLNKVSGTKLSVNDFVIKAASMAAVKVPATNSSWMQDFIRQYKNVNMCFAVQTEHGLMAPCVSNVNLKGLEQISSEIKEIAGRARENKLKPEELAGGTFTVSNLGMYGVNNFSAIVNPPQACILAVGGATKTVVVNENAKEGEEPYKVAHLMNVTLSSDHRVVDGAVAAEWGLNFKKFIESPEQMLL